MLKLVLRIASFYVVALLFYRAGYVFGKRAGFDELAREMGKRATEGLLQEFPDFNLTCGDCAEQMEVSILLEPPTLVCMNCGTTRHLVPFV